MRIVWITKNLYRTPFKTTQFNISDRLRKRGHRVTLVLARDFSGKKLSTNDVLYLPTIDIPILSGLVFGLVLFFYFSFFVKKQMVDIVIFDGDQIWSPFVLSLKMLGVPIIWDVRSLPIDKKRSILHDISYYISRYLVSGLTTISPELCQILKSRYKLHDKKIGIWSSGVSLKEFNPSSSPSFTFQNNANKDTFVLITHGTYSPTRGIENLIQSIGKLDRSLKKRVRLLLVGIPSKKIRYLSCLCEEIGVKNQVEIISPVDQKKIPFYIQAAHVGVIPLPPDNEWWDVSVPLKTLEYLAMKKPIIATAISFHKRIFAKCKCGVLLNSNEPSAFADAIVYLDRKRDKWDEMGKEGRRLVEESYSWEKVAFEIENFIIDICEHFSK